MLEHNCIMGMDWIRLAQDTEQWRGLFENYNKSSRYMKGGELLE
jgi:hypothetical protein